jgi:hypothetical protein
MASRDRIGENFTEAIVMPQLEFVSRQFRIFGFMTFVFARFIRRVECP